MIMLRLQKKGGGVELHGAPVINVVAFYSGRTYRGDYDTVESLDSSSYRGILTVSGRGGGCRLTDTWQVKEDGIQLRRKLRPQQTGGEFREGVRVELEIPLPGGNWRFFVPAACYGESPLEKDREGAMLIEERLAYPLVLAYEEARHQGLVLARINTPAWSEVPRRQKGDASFLHATDIGGMGYRRATGGNPAKIIVSLPYREGPTSRALDRRLRPVAAFSPVDCQRELEVSYELRVISAADYAGACLTAYKLGFTLARPQPKPVELPFTLAEALKYRVRALAGRTRVWNGYTGLQLNFNPRVGIEAPPAGYGRAFNELDSELYPRVLEYGFTGRQLNNAYLLMRLGDEWRQPEWVRQGKAVVDSFVNKCTHRSGFLFTLYDVERGRPFHPFGDPVGAALHYGVAGAAGGNYLRNMVEAAYDLTLCWEITGNSGWLEPARRFGRFLTAGQNHDGSWYRAYTPEGKPVTKPESWFGRTLAMQKGSTSAPAPFLVRLHRISPGGNFLAAAEKAGQWLLGGVIAGADYRGGTLDNANIVDKESMGYAMSALLSLYEQTGREEYLSGAQKAGGMALTWNYLWDVPFEPGTRLHSCRFSTRGWGGIDILWAGSVVDLYALAYVRDWLKLAELTGEEIFRQVATMVVQGTQQMMAYPGNLYGLAACGMQEEGFACSNLGMDEGLIKKGDTWGALGWVYGISAYAMLQVLTIRDRNTGCGWRNIPREPVRE